jgi:hypothetical protein
MKLLSFRWLRSLTVAIILAILTTLAAGQGPASAVGDSSTAAAPTEHTAPVEKPGAGGDPDALRKAAQNPIASMISVPIQNVDNFAIGPYGRIQNVINIQPVIPVQISGNWNLITRVITPIVSQPYPTQPTGGVFGFGDMNPTFFLSPAKSGKLIWGMGPTLVLPTATSDFLGQGKFSMGPSIVLLVQPGKWTFGALVNNVWSVAGSGSRPAVNQMLLQYFVNYNLKKGWYLTFPPIMTANWEASSGQQWVVPLGGGVGRIMRLGMQPVNLSLQFYGNAVHPDNASPWGMKMQVAFLFPKKK